MARKRAATKTTQKRGAKTRPARARAAAKTSRESSVAQTMPGLNGGTLQVGNPGNAGGTGRPPSAIREALRGSFDRRIAILEQIADGDAVVKVKDAFGKETGTTVSASPADRLKAIDTLARYGLGTTKELTVEHVRGRLEQTHRVLLEELAPDVFERVSRRLEAVWR